MKANNAIEWHSQIADDFDLKYQYSKRFIERYEIWTRVITKYSNPDSFVLDIGCGSGIFSFYAAERNGRVIGIDASSKMISLCEHKKSLTNLNNITFFNCDISFLNRALNEQADLILCSSVLEYLDDLQNMINLIYSSLKKNGVFILSIPNKSSLYRNIEAVIFKITGRPRYYKYVKNILTLSKMQKKLEYSGFSILESAYYASTPLLSKIFHIMGLSKYSDNLLIVVAQRPA